MARIANAARLLLAIGGIPPKPWTSQEQTAGLKLNLHHINTYLMHSVCLEPLRKFFIKSYLYLNKLKEENFIIDHFTFPCPILLKEKILS